MTMRLFMSGAKSAKSMMPRPSLQILPSSLAFGSIPIGFISLPCCRQKEVSRAISRSVPLQRIVDGGHVVTSQPV